MLCALTVLGGARAQAGQPGIGVYAVTIGGGHLKLDFHGDQATGCAQHGTCDTSGTLTATLAAKKRSLGELVAFGSTAFGSISTFAETKTQAVVHTPGAPDCVDSVAQDSVSFVAIAHRHKLFEV